jgi:hypothetical protein
VTQKMLMKNNFKSISPFKLSLFPLWIYSTFLLEFRNCVEPYFFLDVDKDTKRTKMNKKDTNRTKKDKDWNENQQKLQTSFSGLFEFTHHLSQDKDGSFNYKKASQALNTLRPKEASQPLNKLRPSIRFGILLRRTSHFLRKSDKYNI